MKNKIMILCVMLVGICYTSCKKDIENSPKGYMKCMVNGEELTSNNCSFTNIFGSLLISPTESAAPSISIYSMGYDGESELIFDESSLHAGIYSTSGTENDYSTAYSFTHGKGKVLFSKKTNKEMVGSFYFTAYNVYETDSMVVTDGSFRSLSVF